ncbi:MAG: GTPase Obg [Chlamydiia bacterium]|nr:GTPase Obg [Chlamydiia bacterium]MCH9616169.1 GTPase Obg [Chlamydiia bacterium]MCH9629845.1 GTPase Obg [Chlamydiia bacterium]
MFTDTVRVKFFAGRGGNGVVAWRREKYIPKGGPCGGNGGPGGSIILEADPQISALDFFRNRRQIRGVNGKAGGTNRRQGAKGKDLILKVPCGTLIKENDILLQDLTKPGARFVASTGGKGGIGNFFFKTPTNQAPNKCTPGKEGDERDLSLELKLIADVGFLGLPNAGKSTLLSTLANIQLKTGAYPFTTLHPNLSTIEFEDYSRLTLADIPGIIEDAHKNKGLGLEFLKHIERTRCLLYILDATDEPLQAFETLQNELKSYSPAILEKPYLVILNKTDLPHAEFPFENALHLSALTGDGTKQLLDKLHRLTQNVSDEKII